MGTGSGAHSGCHWQWFSKRAPATEETEAGASRGHLRANYERCVRLSWAVGARALDKVRTVWAPANPTGVQGLRVRRNQHQGPMPEVLCTKAQLGPWKFPDHEGQKRKLNTMSRDPRNYGTS